MSFETTCSLVHSWLKENHLLKTARVLEEEHGEIHSTIGVSLSKITKHYQLFQEILNNFDTSKTTDKQVKLPTKSKKKKDKIPKETSPIDVLAAETKKQKNLELQEQKLLRANTFFCPELESRLTSLCKELGHDMIEENELKDKDSQDDDLKKSSHKIHSPTAKNLSKIDDFPEDVFEISTSLFSDGLDEASKEKKKKKKKSTKNENREVIINDTTKDNDMNNNVESIEDDYSKKKKKKKRHLEDLNGENDSTSLSSKEKERKKKSAAVAPVSEVKVDYDDTRSKKKKKKVTEEEEPAYEIEESSSKEKKKKKKKKKRHADE